MDNIGSLLRQTRESSGVSIKEASTDLSIDENYLLNIEEGKIGCFKDIFALKDYLTNYAKYLGIDSDKLIDEFNEYMFEYTSKIPLDDLEKEMAVQEKEKIIEETGQIKIVTPYLKPTEESHTAKYVFIAVIIILLVAVTLIWAIKLVL